MTFFYLIVAVMLLALNGFFVLAEFAAVKMRRSRIEELIQSGVAGAKAVQIVHNGLDEYLSVCQLGITFASIGLGFAAEAALVDLIEPVIRWLGLSIEADRDGWLTAHAIAFAISYLLVSFSHILLGELVPKSVAIRLTDQASLWSANPLRLFRLVLFVPLKLLNASAIAIIRLMGFGKTHGGEVHSEDELRILLNYSQVHGVMSFRRLLFLENVFDLGELRIRDAMRPRSQVRCLYAQHTADENMQTIRRYRFTRYPIIDEDPEKPIGIAHLKDMVLSGEVEVDLRSIYRPFITTQENALLESLLSEMQKRRIHVALVRNQAGKWTGFLTLEDVIEEIIGTIRDEFEDEEQVSLSDALTEDRIQLGIEAGGTVEAVRMAVQKMRPESLPVGKETIVRAIEERELLVETYLGNHLGMPHARVPGLNKPVVLVIRSDLGIPYRDTQERAKLLIVLLTPAGQPRVHQRLQAIVATIMDESEYIPERLGSASTAAEILDVLRTGEQTALG